MTKSINEEFEEWLQSKNTKIADRCLEKLNEDILDLWEDEDTRYVEISEVSSHKPIPNYLFHQVLRFIKATNRWSVFDGILKH
ncbi:MAG: hypothetical protein ACTSR2_00130 [Candidatus Hodarchaeales archaeon]